MEQAVMEPMMAQEVRLLIAKVSRCHVLASKVALALGGNFPTP
jgi:hypothetical protein